MRWLLVEVVTTDGVSSVMKDHFRVNRPRHESVRCIGT